MNKGDLLNPLAQRAWKALLTNYPSWEEYCCTCGSDDLEVAVPAPKGSNAGHLVISTNNGTDLWVRFTPPYMAYAVDDVTEMLEVVADLLAGRTNFVVVTQDDKWVETTLARPGEEPEFSKGQLAKVVSWTGVSDRKVK